MAKKKKSNRRRAKILGEMNGSGVTPHAMTLSATTTRVPVVNGHTEAISVEFERTVTREEILEAFKNFKGEPQDLGLPSAPPKPVIYLEGINRPQPRLDVERDGGMVVHVGRLRPCAVLGHKFVILGHNTIRGAAGAAILNAELMMAKHLLG